MSIKYKKRNYCYIEPDDEVKVTTMSNIVSVKNIRHCNNKCQIERLPNNKYKVKKTGEIKEFKNKIENRSQGSIAFNRTRREIRSIINTNCGGDKKKNCKFITLTYKDVMRDTKKLDNDLNIFIKKFRYHYGKDIQYIMLPAPQIKRKEWSFHVHCIFIFKSKAPFIEGKEIQDLWGHGEIDVSSLYGNVDNLGAYFVGHLRDMPLNEVKKLGLPYDKKDIKEVYIDYNTGENLDKPLLIVKGIRTKYYPPHFKILRKSRDLEKPIVEVKEYSEVRKEVGYRKPTYRNTLQLIDEENNWSNTIKTEEYNLSRDNFEITSEEEKNIRSKKIVDDKVRIINDKIVFIVEKQFDF